MSDAIKAHTAMNLVRDVTSSLDDYDEGQTTEACATTVGLSTYVGEDGVGEVALIERNYETRRVGGKGSLVDLSVAAAGSCKKVRTEKAEKQRKPRITYSTEENCTLMRAVGGDDGIFDRCVASKTERWVEITERVGVILEKSLSAESVCKHVDKLEKQYRALCNQENKFSGREPPKTKHDRDLETLMEDYIERKETENVERNERVQANNKKLAADRAKGNAIREAALTTEKPCAKRNRDVARLPPFAYLEKLEEAARDRREQERQRLDQEREARVRFERLLCEGAREQRESARLVTEAVAAIASAMHRGERQMTAEKHPYLA